MLRQTVTVIIDVMDHWYSWEHHEETRNTEDEEIAHICLAEMLLEEKASDSVVAVAAPAEAGLGTAETSPGMVKVALRKMKIKPRTDC